MAAAAFRITFTLVSAVKGRYQVSCTVSDVVDAFALPASGSSDIQLVGDTTLIDAVCSPTYGTDTTRMVIYKDDNLTSEQVINGANSITASTGMRQFQMCPILFKGGGRIKFQQKA